MSEPWKQYRPKLALYEILDKPGGVSVDIALRRAQHAIEHYRGRANNALADKVSELEAIARTRGEANSEHIYELATFVLDIAGIFAPPLCRAANSLCDLVHRMSAAGRWDWPSVDVHVSSMRLLMDKFDDKDLTVLSVLSGLSAVVAKFPDPSPPDPPRPTPVDVAI